MLTAITWTLGVLAALGIITAVLKFTLVLVGKANATTTATSGLLMLAQGLWLAVLTYRSMNL